jgi:hypothetical protein
LLKFIRAFTSQTQNVYEWQDVSKTTWISVDSSYRLNLHAQNAIRFQDSAGGQYAGFKAPATISASYTMTLPTAVGSSGQYLKDSDGAGTLVWDTPSGSGTTTTEVEIDFGTTPQWSKTFTITDAGVSPSSKILLFPSGNVATGRVGNDAEWDNLILAGLAGTGNFEVTAIASPGPIVGKRKVYYQLAA